MHTILCKNDAVNDIAEVFCAGFRLMRGKPLTNLPILIEYHPDLYAEVAEQADALRSGRSEHCAHEGSNPSFGIFYFN